MGSVASVLQELEALILEPEKEVVSLESASPNPTKEELRQDTHALMNSLFEGEAGERCDQKQGRVTRLDTMTNQPLTARKARQDTMFNAWDHPAVPESVLTRRLAADEQTMGCSVLLMLPILLLFVLVCRTIFQRVKAVTR